MNFKNIFCLSLCFILAKSSLFSENRQQKILTQISNDVSDESPFIPFQSFATIMEAGKPKVLANNELLSSAIVKREESWDLLLSRYSLNKQLELVEEARNRGLVIPDIFDAAVVTTNEFNTFPDSNAVQQNLRRRTWLFTRGSSSVDAYEMTLSGQTLSRRSFARALLDSSSPPEYDDPDQTVAAGASLAQDTIAAFIGDNKKNIVEFHYSNGTMTSIKKPVTGQALAVAVAAAPRGGRRVSCYLSQQDNTLSLNIRENASNSITNISLGTFANINQKQLKLSLASSSRSDQVSILLPSKEAWVFRKRQDIVGSWTKVATYKNCRTLLGKASRAYQAVTVYDDTPDLVPRAKSFFTSVSRDSFELEKSLYPLSKPLVSNVNITALDESTNVFDKAIAIGGGFFRTQFNDESSGLAIAIGHYPISNGRTSQMSFQVPTRSTLPFTQISDIYTLIKQVPAITYKNKSKLMQGKCFAMPSPTPDQTIYIVKTLTYYPDEQKYGIDLYSTLSPSGDLNECANALQTIIP